MRLFFLAPKTNSKLIDKKLFKILRSFLFLYQEQRIYGNLGLKGLIITNESLLLNH